MRSRTQLLSLETHRMGRIELVLAILELQDALLGMMLQEQEDSENYPGDSNWLGGPYPEEERCNVER